MVWSIFNFCFFSVARWGTTAPSSPRRSPGTPTPPPSTAPAHRAWRWATARGAPGCRPAWAPAASPAWACTRSTGPRPHRSHSSPGEQGIQKKAFENRYVSAALLRRLNPEMAPRLFHPPIKGKKIQEAFHLASLKMQKDLKFK